MNLGPRELLKAVIVRYIYIRNSWLLHSVDSPLFAAGRGFGSGSSANSPSKDSCGGDG